MTALRRRGVPLLNGLSDGHGVMAADLREDRGALKLGKV